MTITELESRIMQITESCDLQVEQICEVLIDIYCKYKALVKNKNFKYDQNIEFPIGIPTPVNLDVKN